MHIYLTSIDEQYANTVIVQFLIKIYLKGLCIAQPCWPLPRPPPDVVENLSMGSSSLLSSLEMKGLYMGIRG